MLDKLLAVSGRYQFQHVRIESSNAEIQADLAARRGGVIVTAHNGCLELCRALAQQNPLLQLNVLVHTRHSVQFNQILARLNPKFLLNLIEVTQFNAVTAPVATRQSRQIHFWRAPCINSDVLALWQMLQQTNQRVVIFGGTKNWRQTQRQRM